MNYSPFIAFDIFYGFIVLLLVAAAVLIVVLLARLMLAATRTLNAITLDRSVRLDLFLAEDGDGENDTDGSTPA